MNEEQIDSLEEMLDIHDVFSCEFILANSFRKSWVANSKSKYDNINLEEYLLVIRHGPFDISGGGGAWDIFEKKNFLALILTKKNKLAQWHSEKKIICIQ